MFICGPGNENATYTMVSFPTDKEHHFILEQPLPAARAVRALNSCCMWAQCRWFVFVTLSPPHGSKLHFAIAGTPKEATPGNELRLKDTGDISATLTVCLATGNRNGRRSHSQLSSKYNQNVSFISYQFQTCIQAQVGLIRKASCIINCGCFRLNCPSPWR